MNKTSFTLIELLVVVAILAILMAMLLPSLQQARQSAHMAACVNNLRQTLIAIAAYRTDYHHYPTAVQWPIDSATRADYVHYQVRGGYAPDWVNLLGPAAIANPGFRCTAPLPGNAEMTGHIWNLGGNWTFSERAEAGLAGVWNSTRNRHRNWYMYFGPIPYYFYSSSRYFTEADGNTSAYNLGISANYGIPYLTKQPGVGNTLGNVMLRPDQLLARPILCCPSVSYFQPGVGVIAVREPHMRQPDNYATSAFPVGIAECWRVEVRNWGYSDGHVESFRRP